MGKNKYGVDKKKLLNTKQWEAFSKFYNEYKDLSLEELKATYEGFKNPPGGVKKMALLQLANDKMAAIREQTMTEAAAAVETIKEEIKQESDDNKSSDMGI